MCKVGDGDFLSSVQKAPTASPVTDIEELEHGMIVTISAEMDESLRFLYPIDPLLVGSVKCAIGGGSGDGDLYARWDSPVDFERPGREDVSCKQGTDVKRDIFFVSYLTLSNHCY